MKNWIGLVLAVGVILLMSQCKKDNNHDELAITLVAVLTPNGKVHVTNNFAASRIFSLHSDTCSTSNLVTSATVAAGQTDILGFRQLVPFYVGVSVGQASPKCTTTPLTMRFPTVDYLCTVSAAEALSCNSL